MSSAQPHNPALELVALRTAFWWPEQWYERGIDARHFYSRPHVQVLDAIEDVRRTGSDVTTLAVRSALERRGIAITIDMDRLLMDVSETGPAITPYEAEALRDAWTCRCVMEHMPKLEESIQLGNAHELRGALADMVVAAEREQIATGIMSAHAGANDLIAQLDGRQASRTFHLGLPSLDRHLGRLGAGSMMVIGAETGVGKSSLAVEMQDLCERQGHPSAFLSFEDAAHLIDAKYLASASGVSPRNIINRNLTSEQKDRLRKAAAELEKRRIYRTAMVGADHVALKGAMRQAARRGCHLVFVDYLQVIRYQGRANTRAEAIGEITAQTKGLADDLGIGVVMISQLVRPPRDLKRGGRRQAWVPSKNDLKESGDIENAAEGIALLYREEDTDDAPVHGIVAKGKLGGAGGRFLLQRTNGVLREVNIDVGF